MVTGTLLGKPFTDDVNTNRTSTTINSVDVYEEAKEAKLHLVKFLEWYKKQPEAYYRDIVKLTQLRDLADAKSKKQPNRSYPPKGKSQSLWGSLAAKLEEQF